MHESQLSDSWYIQNYVPKLTQILEENEPFLNAIKKEDHEKIHISSYMPIKNEMNIVPIMQEILVSSSEHTYGHSLPIVVEKGLPLVFREYDDGDVLERSKLF